MLSLQEQFAPKGVCFGCGQANNKGLRIRSFPEGDALIARWTPESHHAAFTGVLNGGICGALLDCHSNWAAMWGFMQSGALETPPLTVTASFHVKLKAPTPMDRELIVKAQAIELTDNRATVSSSIEVGGRITATCSGVFICVPDDHPAAIGFRAEHAG